VVLAPLYVINEATMAAATVGAILGVRHVLTDHCGLSLKGLVAIDPCGNSPSTVASCTFAAVVVIEWINLLLLSTPACSLSPK
jgi:hypothetical protein